VCLQALNERQGLFELRELTLVRFECGGMDTPAKPAHLHRVLEVKHFVIQQVLDRVTRTRGAIEYPAHHDRVVGGIVMAEGASRQVLTPGEFWPSQKTAEEPEVECVEDFLKIEEAAVRAREAFGPPGVAYQFRLACNGSARRKPLESQALRGLDWLAVKLGQQDMSNGVQDAFWGTFEKVGKADQNAAFPKPNCGVEGSEAAEPNDNGRHGRPGTNRAVLLLEQSLKIDAHQIGG
jgi:hypothetical protein